MFLSVKSISYSGILLSINIILFLIINYIQINTLFFMIVASFLSSIIIIEFGNKEGFLFSIASMMFSFIFLNNKMHFLLYTFVFCYYGIIKNILEDKFNLIVEYIFKYIYFNITLLLLYFLIKGFIFVKLSVLLLIYYHISVLIYDKVYTSFIIYYTMKLRIKKSSS